MDIISYALRIIDSIPAAVTAIPIIVLLLLLAVREILHVRGTPTPRLDWVIAGLTVVFVLVLAERVRMLL